MPDNQWCFTFTLRDLQFLMVGAAMGSSVHMLMRALGSDVFSPLVLIGFMAAWFALGLARLRN